jgi:hypothetical protein
MRMHEQLRQSRGQTSGGLCLDAGSSWEGWERSDGNWRAQED